MKPSSTLTFLDDAQSPPGAYRGYGDALHSDAIMGIAMHVTREPRVARYESW
jgi:hypothetical protein